MKRLWRRRTARLPWWVRDFPFEVWASSTSIVVGIMLLIDAASPPAPDFFPLWAVPRLLGASLAVAWLVGGIVTYIGMNCLNDLRVVSAAMYLLSITSLACFITFAATNVLLTPITMGGLLLTAIVGLTRSAHLSSTARGREKILRATGGA